jgi:hypothetical protein
VTDAPLNREAKSSNVTLIDPLGSPSSLASYAPRCPCYPPPDEKITENIYSRSSLIQAKNLENNSKLVPLFPTKQSPPSVRPVEETIESTNAWSDPSIPPRTCVIFASSLIGGWIAPSAIVKVVPCISEYVHCRVLLLSVLSTTNYSPKISFPLFPGISQSPLSTFEFLTMFLQMKMHV